MSNLPIRRIVVHYSATYTDQDFGADDIRKMHLTRGFSDIGYHPSLHLIRPPPMSRGIGLYAQRSEKRILGTHYETHSPPADG